MSQTLSEQKELVYVVAKSLGDLNDQVVFVGGCATGLVINDSSVVSVRPTKDVDVIVEVIGRAEYYRLEKKLRSLGFTNDPDGPICRWQIDSIIVDVMPDDESILGFSNRWYESAIQTAQAHELKDIIIRVVTPALFLATKLEAFRGRGEGDFLSSHDIEDFLAVIDGRPDIVRNCFDAPNEVKQYLHEEIEELLENQEFMNALPGYAVTQSTSPASTDVLLDRLQNITKTLGRST